VRNTKLFLILLMTMILIIAPMLSVEASVNGGDEDIHIDLSDAVIQNGYFSLPVEESVVGHLFRIVYYPGFVDKSNNFVALGTRHMDSHDWAGKKVAKVPVSPKLVMISGTYFFSYGNDFAPELYRIPVELNGKEVLIDVIFKGGRGNVDSVTDDDENEYTLKSGDVIKPIYKQFTNNSERKDVVQEDKKIVYRDALTFIIMEIPYTDDNFAFKLFAQSTGTEGHAFSDVVAPATFTPPAAKPKNPSTNNTPTSNNVSSPSQWAKAEIDKAKESGLTTERVLNEYQKPITREEFCELTVNLYEKLSGKTAEPISPNPFKDTSNIAVLKAYKLGIVNGTGNGEFSPNKPLNREQMAKMFFNTLQLAKPGIENVAEELSFTDRNSISQWAIQSVKFMFKEEIILGSNNMFNPQQEASREQAIALVNRVFEKFNK
jgi:hypothetical protein